MAKNAKCFSYDRAIGLGAREPKCLRSGFVWQWLQNHLWISKF